MEIDHSHDTQLRVRYGETDQMGYCYYGNYAQYFEVGRVEALRELGVSYRKMEENGIMLPVSYFQVNHHRPAIYDDLLCITTKIVQVKGSRLYFEYSIKNEAGQLIATAKTTLAFVRKSNMRPTPCPESILQILAQYEK
jgi:acyl-CoA thioester hydrolase